MKNRSGIYHGLLTAMKDEGKIGDKLSPKNSDFLTQLNMKAPSINLMFKKAAKPKQNQLRKKNTALVNITQLSSFQRHIFFIKEDYKSDIVQISKSVISIIKEVVGQS
jgi:hypothetical protein